MDKKICPIKAVAYQACLELKFCSQEYCAWWLDTLGVCGVIADQHLKGLEIVRQEMKGERE